MEDISVRWLPIALLMAVSPVVAVYSGTFLDDFSDGNLDGWEIWQVAPPPVVELARLEGGHLVLDTTHGKNDRDDIRFKFVSLELNAGNAAGWDSYTLTCRIRFAEVRGGRGSGFFNICVRSSPGQFDLVAEQVMQILLVPHSIDVTTVPPDAKRNPKTKVPDGEIHRPVLLPADFPAIKLNRWLPIRIVAEKDAFEFYIDDNLVAQYLDETAAPGTVRFEVLSEMLVHIDDLKITGPDIPNVRGAQSIYPDGHLTTTWGKIKNPSQR